jgi:hypothetical protein
MESSLLRAQKAANAKGQAAHPMIDAARGFLSDAAERVEHEATRAIAARQGKTAIHSRASKFISAGGLLLFFGLQRNAKVRFVICTGHLHRYFCSGMFFLE